MKNSEAKLDSCVVNEEDGRSKLLLRSAKLSFVVSLPLGIYISLTTFNEMSLDIWQTGNNFLVVATLLAATYVGYSSRLRHASVGYMLLSVVLFYLITASLYLASYVATTTFFSNKMVWIPFFHRDYTYHSFKSVAQYLNHRDNFRDLLELQVFSWVICSIIYVVAGSVGYGARVLLETRRQHRPLGSG